MNSLFIILAIVLVIFVCFTVKNQIREQYLQNDPILKGLVEKFKIFFNEYMEEWPRPLEMLNNRDIMNEILIYRGDKSYTINKKHVYICLKNEKGEYYDENMLTYVLAHEIAHTLCDEVGHTDKFHEIFENLLVHMTTAGLYNPSIPLQPDYCVHGDDEL